jgi:hypothetical protein
MSRAKSLLFYTMTLAVLSYSAFELGLTKVSADVTTVPAVPRRCCTYQTHCLSNQTCVTIFPTCSPTRPHICQQNPVVVEPGEVVPGEGEPVANP